MTRVIRKYHADDDKEVKISDAVEASLTWTGYDVRGVAEEAGDVANNCAKAIGVVVERLVERGLLTKHDLDQMLNHNYRVDNG